MNDAKGRLSLEEVLTRARAVGLLGRRADPAEEIAHCAGFVAAVRRLAGPDATVVDLGSGNGLPGLVVATACPVRVMLVEAGERRASFLRWAIGGLGVQDRACVREGEAEKLARDPDLRGRAEFVVARSFGPPAVTAECAVGFLSPGGAMVVSEPPGENPGRWPTDGLALLGLVDWGKTEEGVRIISLAEEVDDRWPRPSPRPRRSPLFVS